MQCFNGNSSYSIFESLKTRLKDDISKLKAEELDSTDRDEWVDYWENEYFCPPVVLWCCIYFLPRMCRSGISGEYKAILLICLTK